MQKIVPYLWYENSAEEAARYYVSVFEGFGHPAKILTVTHYDKAASQAAEMPEGSVMTVEFELAGQKLVALNGGSYYKMTGAVSFLINCETQEEVDYFWEKLGEGGKTSICGWIERDKFGLTWQVTPTILERMLADPDKEKSGRVMQAMLKMKKLNIAALKEAYEKK